MMMQSCFSDGVERKCSCCGGDLFWNDTHIIEAYGANQEAPSVVYVTLERRYICHALRGCRKIVGVCHCGQPLIDHITLTYELPIRVGGSQAMQEKLCGLLVDVLATAAKKDANLTGTVDIQNIG